jgi:ATP/maltotriose-dependent transcriptional regulator MalT
MQAITTYAYVTAVARFEAALPLLAGRELAVALLALADMHRQQERGVEYAAEAVRVADEAGETVLAAVCRLRLGSFCGLLGEMERGIAEMTTANAVLDTLPQEAVEQMTPTAIFPFATAQARQGLLMHVLALSGRYAPVQALLGCTVDEAVARLEDLPNSARFAVAHLCAVLGRGQDALDAFARARAYVRTQEHWYLVGRQVRDAIAVALVPYRTDDLSERARLVAELEEVLTYRDAMPGTPPLSWLTLWPLLMLEGDWDEARARWSEFATARPAFWQWAVPYIAMMAQAQGDADTAWRLTRELLPAGPKTEPGGGHFQPQRMLQCVAVMLALDADDLPGAKAWLEAHDRWLAWSQAVPGRSEGEALWAAYYRQAGDHEPARRHAEAALTHATEPRQPFAQLTAHRLLGELATGAGDVDEATAHLTAALALAEACAAPYERALTLLAQAELGGGTGDTEQARTVLDEVTAICEPLGAKPALARVAALAARLADVATVVPAYPAGLSSREVEVLHLVAQGLTNPQVAERLYLSPRTVEQHLRSIYNKVGVSTRAAATHFAVTNNLA